MAHTNDESGKEVPDTKWLPYRDHMRELCSQVPAFQSQRSDQFLVLQKNKGNHIEDSARVVNLRSDIVFGRRRDALSEVSEMRNGSRFERLVAVFNNHSGVWA